MKTFMKIREAAKFFSRRDFLLKVSEIEEWIKTKAAS
jgi:hypothetical protein